MMSSFDTHIEAMHTLPQTGGGVDLLIISTSSEAQALFWEKRLLGQRGKLIAPHAEVIAISENWEGGAGNGLGTLYALNEASKRLETLTGFSLSSFLQQGKSIALYHTAGKGKRLSPLTGCESNNKSAVELPAFHRNDNTYQPLSILEMVIRQTSILSHPGRVSVFWSDQLFIPSKPLQKTPTAHISIFSKGVHLNSCEEWEAKGLMVYGLLHKGVDGSTRLSDKLTPHLFRSLEKKGFLDLSETAISLGSFSLSQEITSLLIESFQRELELRKEKMDTDPDFWMPLSWDLPHYMELMHAKNRSPERSLIQHNRMQTIAKQLKGALFSSHNIGEASYWWDFGTLKSYVRVNKILLEDSLEGEALRRLFHVSRSSSNSILVNCSINKGTIVNSILVGVKAESADFENALVIGGYFKEVQGKECLLYHVWTPNEEKSTYEPQSVRADCFVDPDKKEGHFSFFTSMHRDGDSDWERRLDTNPMSYSELYSLQTQTASNLL